jgi:hypothetical protein
MADDVRVNGHQHSWGSTKFKVDGEEFTGVTSFDFGDKLESAMAYGTGKGHGPRGRSSGKYSCEPLVLVMWKSSAQALRAQLAKKSSSAKSYGKVIFQAVLQYVEAGDTPITVDFQDCKWAENKGTDEENPDPLKETVTVQPMRILRNGLALYEL